MLRKNLLFAILLFIMAAGKADGQTTFTKGNLIKIGFDQKEASFSDTLGAWNEVIPGPGDYFNNNYRSRYFDHITIPGHSYLLKKFVQWFDAPFLSWAEGSQDLESEGTLKSRPFAGTGAGWDVIPPYMTERTGIIYTKNGYWLINDNLGNAFLSNIDTLTLFDPWNHPGSDKNLAVLMTAIIGKAGDKYLAALPKKDMYYNYDYSLVSLDDSPFIDSLKSVKVTFTNNDDPHNSNAITDVKKISGDLYAVKKLRKEGIDIYRYSDTAFYYVKTTLKESFSYSEPFFVQWDCRNGKLYNIGYDEPGRLCLESFEFRISDTSFVNRKVLIDSLNNFYYDLNNNFAIDKNFKYAAKIFHYPAKRFQDSLKIYDIDNEKFINSIYLGSAREPFQPVVDSPYVYIHQITDQHTGVEDNKSMVVKSYSLSAYPNPFNATVKITYSLPEDSNAELDIYDMLGRRITSLVNGPVQKGTHEVMFNAKNLSSGIYLYTLKTGSYMKTNKIMLMK